MKSIAFGALRFDRYSIPLELSDINLWPRADDPAGRKLREATGQRELQF